MKFESQYYRSIDLGRAAKEQFGSSATLTSVGEHLYDWRAQVGSELKKIDLKAAVASQFGPDCSLVMVGVHKNNWKALRFTEPVRYVLPVMLVASDQFYNIEGVRKGLENFKSAIGRIQDWYNGYLGGRLHLLQPLVLKTSYTSAQWNDLSNVTKQEGHRYDLSNAEMASYEKYLPSPGQYLKVALAPYTGDSPHVYLGAAAHGQFACVAPRSTSVACPATGDLSEAAKGATYALGHEMGHTFGLKHSCTQYPGEADCWNSIMEHAYLPGAILLPQEVDFLMKTTFINANWTGTPMTPAYKAEQMGEFESV